MPAAPVLRLVTKPQRIARGTFEAVATALMSLPLGSVPEHERQTILNSLYRVTSPGSDPGVSPWRFFMLGIAQITYVWDAIRSLPPQDRPQQVRHAFDIALANLRQDTGEIMLRRDQIADQIGCRPDHVSTVMGVLARIGAITREIRRVEGMRGPGVAVYFINPNVGWNGNEALRRQAAEAAPPLLQLMQGGRSDQ